MLLPADPALDLQGASLAPGDHVAALAPDGTCVGVTEWTGDATALTLWADDPTTPHLDGLQPGSPVAFAVWDRSEDLVLDGSDVMPAFDPAFAPDQGFALDAVYLLDEAEASGRDDEGILDAHNLGAPFPNPTTGRSRVPLTLATESTVAVDVFDMLGRRVSVPLDGATLGPGHHEIPVDATGLSSGVYVVRVRVDQAMLQTRLSVSR